MKQSVIPTMEDIRARADIPVFEVAGALEPMTGPVQVGSNDIYSVLLTISTVRMKSSLPSPGSPMMICVDTFMPLSCRRAAASA